MKTKVTNVLLSGLVVVAAAVLLISTAGAEPYMTHFDLVLDEARQQLYGSIPETGEIQVISTTDLALKQTITLGASVYGLDMSPDGQQLAAAVESENRIALINLDTLAVSGYVNSPQPFDVAYGRPGRLYATGNGYPYRLTVLDTASKTKVGESAEWLDWKTRLAVTVDGDTVFAGSGEGSRAIHRFDVSSDDPVETAKTDGDVYLVTFAIAPDGSRVFTSRGQAWSGDLSTVLGTFSSGDEIEYVPELERLYVTDGYQLTVVSATDYQVVTRALRDLGVGVARANASATTLYASTFGYQIERLPINPDLTSYLPAVVNRFCADYRDDFSNPASGWPVVDQPAGVTGYDNGEYRITTKDLTPWINPWFVAPAPSCLRPEYVVEADVRWGEAIGFGYGLMLGLSEDRSEYYLLEIDATSRSYTIWHFEGDSYGYWGPYHSTAINQGKVPNHIKGVRDYDPSGRSRILLEVNGVQIIDLIAEGLEEVTGVGLFSRSMEVVPITPRNGVSDARFDNFAFYPLPPAPVGTPPPWAQAPSTP